jgi:hypothetical protein
VPASRPASFLQSTINLAAVVDAVIVILASKQTKLDQVAHQLTNTPAARGLIVEVPDDWSHDGPTFRTSSPHFFTAKANRQSDLSNKRNLGLLLARLHGWNKILFLDDDIRIPKFDSVTRIMDQLDVWQVAGMCVPHFPDNSVVCHARRLSGQFQDVFVTGAAMGVHCNSLPLSFFPDIYNEDWFFFAREVAGRKLPNVGTAVQTGYDPFVDPQRARSEEFGDLLAEGLFALFDEWVPDAAFSELAARADRDYWSQFIEARYEILTYTRVRLLRAVDRSAHSHRICAAVDSLAAAQEQLVERITADLCVDFVDAWLDDLQAWKKFSIGINSLGSTRGAMDFLGLANWHLEGLTSAEYANLRCA